MPKITIELTDKRYAALAVTASIHAPDGTAESYLQSVINSACDSYAQTNETVAAQVYKDRAEQEAAAKKQLEEQVAVLRAEKQAALDAATEKEAAESASAQLDRL